MNAAGLALLQGFESCRLHAYLDGGGVPTIGWGHTAGVKMGDTMTQFEADETLLMDLEDREATLTALLNGVPTSSNEFSALLCLAFNIGFGNPNHLPKPIPGLRTSKVLQRHRLGNHIGASKAFVLWNKDNGVVIPGLTRRRVAEAKLYLLA